MQNLKLYYWEKIGYHEGASFAIAENLQEAKELIIEKFKTDWLEENKEYPWVELFIREFIENGRNYFHSENYAVTYNSEEDFYQKETGGEYSGLIEDLQREPKVFDVTSKQGFYICASL